MKTRYFAFLAVLLLTAFACLPALADSGDPWHEGDVPVKSLEADLYEGAARFREKNTTGPVAFEFEFSEPSRQAGFSVARTGSDSGRFELCISDDPGEFGDDALICQIYGLSNGIIINRRGVAKTYGADPATLSPGATYYLNFRGNRGDDTARVRAWRY